jgi:hypothetical protein
MVIGKQPTVCLTAAQQPLFRKHTDMAFIVFTNPCSTMRLGTHSTQQQNIAPGAKQTCRSIWASIAFQLWEFDFG